MGFVLCHTVHILYNQSGCNNELKIVKKKKNQFQDFNDMNLCVYTQFCCPLKKMLVYLLTF